MQSVLASLFATSIAAERRVGNWVTPRGVQRELRPALVLAQLDTTMTGVDVEPHKTARRSVAAVQDGRIGYLPRITGHLRPSGCNAGMYDHILSLVSPSGLASGPTHMPKFLRIGVHQSNVSGYTSKAWWVRRVGSAVFLKWGAVEVHGVGDGRKIYWTLPPRAKTIRCGTVQRAKNYTKTAIARRRSHRYEPLAGNIAIRRRRANRGAELEQALATILFVDIVRSTEKAALLGDSRWTQVMNHYYAAVRRELKSLRGKEVVSTGDGVLATFDAPASGIRCATAIREAMRTLGLEIRMGLHAGEYKVNGADVVGLAFHVGARVAAKARAGEVLVSSAVKDLMSQSGIRFKDRGVHRLKGVPKRWHLYRVEQ